MTLRLLDTFSGIGGFSLAARWLGGFETVQFVEREPFCRRILAKHWPDVPIHDDITTFQPEPSSADVICGGFPCQDISAAGKQAGIKIGTRSGLFYELMRVVRMVEPRYVVLENVAAIVNGGLDIVLGELAEAGFNAEWACIPASAVGACHRRDRWWLVAYASGGRCLKQGKPGSPAPKDAEVWPQWYGDSHEALNGYSRDDAHRPRRDTGPADPISLCGKRRGAAGNVAGAAGTGEADSEKQKRDGNAPNDCGAVAAHVSHLLGHGGTAGHGGKCGPQAVLESRNGCWPTAPRRLSPDWRSYVSEPVVCVGNDGIPNRLARLKALGNAVVPQVAMIPLQRVLDLAEGAL